MGVCQVSAIVELGFLYVKAKTSALVPVAPYR